MTDFEKQVATALRTITFSGGTAGLVALPMDDEHIEQIAPRVAKAIIAAIEAYPAISAEKIELGQKRALEALRGNW